jgi:hypothetical protein
MTCPWLWLSGLRAGAAGLDLLQGSATTRELLLDSFDGRGPHEGWGVLVPRLEKGLDGRLQIGYAEEDAAADSLVVQVAEPSLDKIHPTGTGRNEVRHEPRMTFPPRLYFRVLVRPLVVHDQR